MVGAKGANVTLMRYDNLANALHLVVSACRRQLAPEARYWALGGQKGMVECQRRGDIVAVLRRVHLGCTRICEVLRSSGCHDSGVDCGEG